MAFNWSNALLALGQAAPRVGAAFDDASRQKRQDEIDAEDREKKNALNELQMKSTGLDIGAKERMASREQGAYDTWKKIKDEQSASNDPELAREQAITEAWHPNMTKPDVQNANILGGIAQKEYKPQELKSKDVALGMAEYADVPFVKNTIANLQDEESSGGGSQFGGTTATAQMAKIFTDKDLNESMRQSAVETLELKKQNGVMTEREYALWKPLVDKYPAAYTINPKWLTDIYMARQSNLEGKRQEIPIAEEKSGRTSYARASGDMAAGRDAPKGLGMSEIDPNTGKAFTVDQKTAAKFVIGMERGIDNIDKLVNKGFDEADITTQVLNLFNKKEKLSRADILNVARTPEQRQYLQAQLDFMVPHLRDQSGAAINRDEYTTEASQYHPLVGDDAATIAQKRDARYSELAARKAHAGEAAYNYWKGFEKQEIESRRSKRESKPSETGAVESKPSETGAVKISSDAEYDKLPSGAQFIGPDGKSRRKP